MLAGQDQVLRIVASAPAAWYDMVEAELHVAAAELVAQTRV
jgi:hypothetical protein